MWLKLSLLLTIALLQAVYIEAADSVEADSYEDARCKCLCPNVVGSNATHNNRNLYIAITATVPPNQCNCDGAILSNPESKIRELIGDKGPEFCVRCECKYENRNTTIIKVVVIIVIWVISLLVVYMLFLICLDPLLNKRVQSSYTEHTNEDELGGGEGTSHPMGVRSSNVLNRVGHQQDKWKRQVREQRRNIYDRHTMLN